MNILNNRTSSTEALSSFNWIDIASTIEWANAYLVVQSDFMNTPIKLEAGPSIQWVKPTSPDIKSKNGTYTLDELLTETKNQELFAEWKQNIGTELEVGKLRLLNDFQTKIDEVREKAIWQWYDLNNNDQVLDYFDTLVSKFDQRIVYTGPYDVFMRYEPIQKFFEQYWLNYQKAIWDKSPSNSVVSQSRESVKKILN